MEREEIIKHLHEALNSVDITFPYRYVLVEAIEALSQPSFSSNLEEAADKYAYSIYPSEGVANIEIYNAYIAGAEWQKARMGEQARKQLAKDEITLADLVAFDEGCSLGRRLERQNMMKEAIEIKVKEDAGGFPIVPLDAIELYDYENDKPLAKAGDKVRVIIIKED